MGIVPTQPNLFAKLQEQHGRINRLESAYALSANQLFYDYEDPAITVTDTSFVVGTEGPEVDATLRQSGLYRVVTSCYIEMTAADQTGTVGLFIDGVYAADILALGQSGAPMAMNVTNVRVIAVDRSVSGPGPTYNFSLQYKVSAGSTVQFAARYIEVTAL